MNTNKSNIYPSHCSLFWIATLYMVWVERRTANAHDISFSLQLMMTAVVGVFWITVPAHVYVKSREVLL